MEDTIAHTAPVTAPIVTTIDDEEAATSYIVDACPMQRLHKKIMAAATAYMCPFRHCMRSPNKMVQLTFNFSAILIIANSTTYFVEVSK